MIMVYTSPSHPFIMPVKNRSVMPSACPFGQGNPETPGSDPGDEFPWCRVIGMVKGCPSDQDPLSGGIEDSKDNFFPRRFGNN